MVLDAQSSVGHAGGTRFYFAYATQILFRFYFDFEVESRGTKPLVESGLFFCPIIAVRDGVHVKLDLGMLVSASDCSPLRRLFLNMPDRRRALTIMLSWLPP